MPTLNGIGNDVVIVATLAALRQEDTEAPYPFVGELAAAGEEFEIVWLQTSTARIGQQ